MTEIEFLNLVTPRVGPTNAINFTQSASVNALVELLVEKKLITKKEHAEKMSAGFEKIQAQIMAVPIVSPIQNHPRK